FHAEVPGLWPEDHTATAPQWGLERTGAGAAGAFLPPGFFVCAGYFANIFRARCAHALRCPVRDHRIVNGLGPLAVFDEREFDFQFALVLAFGIFNCKLHKSLDSRGGSSLLESPAHHFFFASPFFKVSARWA